MVEHLVLVNGTAGAVDVEATARVVAELRRGGGAELVATHSVAELDAAIARLGERRLVVCGGDGSLHLVAQRLAAAERLASVEVGLVPLGTGNDLARGLGLPLQDPAAAARRVVTGHARPLDLLVADDGAICLNAAHAGAGAAGAARAAPLKDRLGTGAYTLGSLLAGAAMPAVPARVSVDGEPWLDDEVLLVAVCNGSTVGGGTGLAPGADPADGRLDVVAVTATGTGRRVGFALALGRERHTDRADVHTARGRRVTVAASLRYDVDGELDDMVVSERTWRVAPAAWHLRC